MPQKPSIGRTVHYVTRTIESDDLKIKAAIVTAVDTDEERATRGEVSLAVLHNSGIEFLNFVPYDEAGSLSTWHWPERI